MKNIAIATVLAFLCQGCAAALIAALLSGGQVDDLANNFEETIQTQQQLAQYATAAARGSLDLDGYTYDPPSEANGMTGTLSMGYATLPFGDGMIEVTFQVAGDGEPVDPYAVDLSGMGFVDGNVQIVFRGLSPRGKALEINADVDVSTIENNSTDVRALMAGDWHIDLDGYGTSMSSNGVEFDIDLVTNQVTNAYGRIDGKINIPNFPVDGNFDVDGLGDRLEVGIDVLVTRIDFLVDLIDMF